MVKKPVNNARPQCVVIAGPNGAGKSSAAPDLLKDAAGIATFVNADVIAQGLAAVATGGHHVPDDVVRRRFRRSLASAGRLSAMGVATWRIYDGSGLGPPRIVVEATEGGLTIVHDPATWVEIVSGATEAE